MSCQLNSLQHFKLLQYCLLIFSTAVSNLKLLFFAMCSTKQKYIMLMNNKISILIHDSGPFPCRLFITASPHAFYILFLDCPQMVPRTDWMYFVLKSASNRSSVNIVDRLSAYRCMFDPIRNDNIPNIGIEHRNSMELWCFSARVSAFVSANVPYEWKRWQLGITLNRHCYSIVSNDLFLSCSLPYEKGAQHSSKSIGFKHLNT